MSQLYCSVMVYVCIVMFCDVVCSSCVVVIRFALVSNIIFSSRKYGFQRQQRNSFEDILGQLKGQHPNLHRFLPSMNTLPFLDRHLQPVAVAPHQNMGTRQVDVVSNTSKV